MIYDLSTVKKRKRYLPQKSNDVQLSKKKKMEINYTYSDAQMTTSVNMKYLPINRIIDLCTLIFKFYSTVFSSKQTVSCISTICICINGIMNYNIMEGINVVTKKFEGI